MDDEPPTVTVIGENLPAGASWHSSGIAQYARDM